MSQTGKSKIVCLDPGHGPGDPGAVVRVNNTIVKESELAFLLCRRAKEPLIRAGDIRIVWTHVMQEQPTLARRVATAVANRATHFVSIHCNAGPPSARGLEVFYADGYGAGKALAERFSAAMKKMVPGLVFRGVKPDNQSQHRSLYVLRATMRRGIPAMLIEAGFLTNAADRELMESPYFGLAIGYAITEALSV